MIVNTERIIFLRKRLNITQEAVANRLGMTRVTYNLRERFGNFTEDELKNLSNLLQVSKDDLFKPATEKKESSIQTFRSFIIRLQDERKNMIAQLEKIKEEEIKQYILTVERSKEELAIQLQKTIKEQTFFLNEAEGRYHERYIKLLEIQLNDKQETIKELKDRYTRLEQEIRIMVEKMESFFHQTTTNQLSLQKTLEEINSQLSKSKK